MRKKKNVWIAFVLIVMIVLLFFCYANTAWREL